MQYPRLILCLLAVVGAATASYPDRATLPQRWFYLNANRHGLDPARIDADIALVKRAAAAGYNGAVFEDLNLGLLDMLPSSYASNVRRLAAAAEQAGIELVPQVAVPYGERVLKHNPNLAEGFPVVDATFVARAGRLELVPDRPAVDGGAARVIPRREYRVSAAGGVRVTDPSGHPLAYPPPGATRVLFNSRDNRHVRIQGAGATLEEVGPVNLLRREGTPFRLTTADGEALVEGRDFLPVADPAIEAFRRTGRYSPIHPAPEIRLAPGSRVHEGDRVHAGWYHAALVHQEDIDQGFACLSESELYQIWTRQVEAIDGLMRPRRYLIGHDEIRAANSCAACARLRRSAGEAIAESARRALAIVREVNPKAEICAWSDMFDPYENAVARYYLVEGSLAGGWNGLDRSVEIVNWSDRIDSYRWFARRGHAQALAGYYDGEEPPTDRWLPRVRREVPLTGVMYTTWKSDYTQLEPFAAALWGSRP